MPADEASRPATGLTAGETLRFAVAGCCQDGPALARVVGEAHAGLLSGGSAGQCLPDPVIVVDDARRMRGSTSPAVSGRVPPL